MRDLPLPYIPTVPLVDHERTATEQLGLTTEDVLHLLQASDEPDES